MARSWCGDLTIAFANYIFFKECVSDSLILLRHWMVLPTHRRD
ncbi:uncharacterized protein G2W53_035368 [Senna tora]|uniref:Uncharacterized protein n=1 Tax=Senna tora TaxID=362788 RepID=A0A834W3Y8_9FABA|nr:uncharacterized protein G2W53_035368 [Senna tora]